MLSSQWMLCLYGNRSNPFAICLVSIVCAIPHEQRTLKFWLCYSFSYCYLQLNPCLVGSGVLVTRKFLLSDSNRKG